MPYCCRQRVVTLLSVCSFFIVIELEGDPSLPASPLNLGPYSIGFLLPSRYVLR